MGNGKREAELPTILEKWKGERRSLLPKITKSSDASPDAPFSPSPKTPRNAVIRIDRIDRIDVRKALISVGIFTFQL